MPDEDEIAAYGDHDTRGLHEFDPESRELVREVFRHPDFDVLAAIFDYDRRDLIAAVYQEAGSLKYHYLDDFRRKHLPDIQSLGLGESVQVTSSSRDHRFFALAVHGAPGCPNLLSRDRGRDPETEFDRLMERPRASPTSGWRSPGAEHSPNLEQWYMIARALRWFVRCHLGEMEPPYRIKSGGRTSRPRHRSPIDGRGPLAIVWADMVTVSPLPSSVDIGAASATRQTSWRARHSLALSRRDLLAGGRLAG